MQDLIEILQRVNKPKILCVGDVMLDVFVFGKVERICPEAPVPVFVEESREYRLGGAGRVAAMAKALGAESTVISAVSDDCDHETELGRLLYQDTTDFEVKVYSGKNSSKTRYMVGDRQIFRADQEEVKDLACDIEATVIDYLEANVPKCDIILISDYGKGVCTTKIMDAVWNFAKQHKKKWIVDPALGANPAKYNGANCMVPNRKKYSQAIADMIHTGSTEVVIQTKDGEGMAISTKAGYLTIAAMKTHVRDCIGASDQVLSMLGVAMASGAEWFQAAQLANIAAGIKVGRGPVDPMICLADVIDQCYCLEDSEQTA